MIRVVIVDDHPVVREGLAAVLGAAGDLDVVGDAPDGLAALGVVERSGPDVVLMDLRMPRGDGIEAIRALRARSAATPRVLVLTTYDTDGMVRAALDAGADGLLLKDTPGPELIDAVRRVHAGMRVLAPRAAALLTAGDESTRLTGRELDVLREIADGGTNRAAADRLFISETTLKTHLSRAFDKLGAHDRVAALRIARERGLL